MSAHILKISPASALAYTLLLFVFSCTPDEPVVPVDDAASSTPSQYTSSEDMTQLGKKLKNPYSVENMRKAYEKLKKSTHEKVREVLQDIEIKPSHLYVKFIPKDESDMDALIEDSTLNLFDFPLDYKIEKLGYYYHDPSVPADRPTPQYCAVPVGYTFPQQVERKILAELFIPQEVALTDKNISADMADALAYEAEKINDNDTLKRQKVSDPRLAITDLFCDFFGCNPSWTPGGTIKVWQTVGERQITRWERVVNYWRYVPCNESESGEDNGKGPRRSYKQDCKVPVYETVKRTVTVIDGKYAPVVGAKVRVWRWFSSSDAFTDENGYYTYNRTFRGPVLYSLEWARYDFSIRAGAVGRASYPSHDTDKPWNLNIRGGKQQYYATIFRAAHHYYYENIKRLKRPPTNAWSRPQMKIGAYFKSNEKKSGAHNKGRRLFGVRNVIRIYNPDRLNKYIYGSTIHELAHASHWELRRNEWDKNHLSKKVIESWARGVEWELTRMKYANYPPDYSRLRYTGIVQDLIDGFKTVTSDYYWTKENPWVKLPRNYTDSVSGYTIKQIEDVLHNTSTWDEWKENIKNNYRNATENKLDAAFAFWNTR